MPIILVGYPGSQSIVQASNYLIRKYLPDFIPVFLNYEGPIEEWSNYCADYLEKIDDEKVIFALDDYFINGANLEELAVAMKEGPCVKLCETSEQEHIEYPCTTQYTIWDRKLLISILRQTASPWDFEMRGSRLMPITPTVRTCIYYDVHSVLSNRWRGLNLKGVKEEDLDYLTKNKLL